MKGFVCKRITTALICGLMIAITAFPAYGTAQDRIAINGDVKALSNNIITTEASVLIPFRSLSELTGMTITWDSSIEGIRCIYNKQEYIFKRGSKSVIFNGTERVMSAPFQIINGVGYIPLNSVVDVFKGTLSNINDTYQMTLATETGKEYGQYTFNELQEIALKNSTEMATANSNYKRAALMYDEAVDDHFEYPANDGSPAVEAVRLSNLLNLSGQEISLKTAEIAILTTQERVGYQLKTLLNGVIAAEGDLSVAKGDYEIQKKIQSQSELKFQLGLMSQYEYQKTSETLKSKELAISLKQSAMDAILTELDSLLKLGRGNYEFLNNSTITYTKLEDHNLDAHIAKILETSPDIWALKQIIKLKQDNINYYIFNAGLDPFEAKEIDITVAKQNLDAAVLSTDVALRQSYEQLIQLERTYESLQVELDKLKKDYAVANMNLRVGLTTELAVEQLQQGIASVDQQLLVVKKSYMALKEAYLKPWAAQ